MTDLIYSRDIDGGLPVKILDAGGYEIIKPEGEIIRCSSNRQLLINLTGHPEGRNWTFDRYFKRGHWADPGSLIEPMTPVLELFEPGGIIMDSGRPIPRNIRRMSSGVTVPASNLGIDLAARGDEVAKLLFAGFRNWIFSANYDPDDVLQEVYKGILIRNQGTCPFDARKASFGHYVHQVCHCILSNYHRREHRRRSREQTGMMEFQDGCRVEGDVSDVQKDEVTEGDPGNNLEHDLIKTLQMRPTPDNRLAIRLIPLLGMGYNQGDMADILKVSRTAVGKAVKAVRKAAVQCGYVPDMER